MLTNKRSRSVLHLFSLKGFDIMKDKKKSIKSIIKLSIFVGVVLIILCCTVPFTYRVDKKLEGIKWQNKNSLLCEKSDIAVNGYIKNYLFWTDKFVGTIEIDGKRCVYDDNHIGSSLALEKDTYPIYYKNDDGDYQSLGMFESDGKLDKIFVTLYEIANDGSGSWSSSNGVIITAPAVTRDEAVKVSKKLVKGEHFEDELE